MKKAIKINPSDNVAVALADIHSGDVVDVEGKSIELVSFIKAKHKFAMDNIRQGEKIIMYGVTVGKSNTDIPVGEVLTVDNVKHLSENVSGRTSGFDWEKPDVDKWKDRTFMGYHRDDGQVGTANIWLFFPLVFCENRNIQTLKEIFEKEFKKERVTEQQRLLRSLMSGNDTQADAEDDKQENVYDNIEVKFITHQGGCGGIRQDSEMLAKLLAGYVNNPNVAGCTVLSLGCQNLQIDIFKDALKQINPDLSKPVLIYEQQQMGTVEQMLNTVITDSFAAIKKANEMVRKPAPLSKLSIGLECGGSDGFSGISANPTLGHVSDLLVALDGQVVLSEFPELCGVEQELVNRCADDQLVSKFLGLMNDFEQSVIDAGSGFDMNPSPGNIKDGLITDAMKSAGAAKKGGNSPVEDVLDYCEYATRKGLNLLCTPGNDVESTTGMAASGTNLILFTTGLGTPTGNPVVPVIKVSSNSDLAQKMSDIIDVDTGPVIKGELSIEEMGEQLLDYIVKVASGDIQTKASILDQNDFIPWKRGVSL